MQLLKKVKIKLMKNMKWKQRLCKSENYLIIFFKYLGIHTFDEFKANPFLSKMTHNVQLNRNIYNMYIIFIITYLLRLKYKINF